MNGGISGRTKVFAVFGKPISHTLSPAMHNAAFRRVGLDAVYAAFEVGPENLEKALLGAAAMGFGGLNITVPHKRAAYLLAAEKDVTAASTGAANTLVPCKDGWKAYNTDVAGFISAVGSGLGFTPPGRRTVVLGAGGAARAAVSGLLSGGADRVYVAARNINAAAALAGEISSGAARAEAVDIKDVSGLLGPGDLLVSATPLGLDPDAAWPFPLGALDPGVVVYDMAYGAGETSLERQAKKAGLKAASGRGMLLMQGAEAFSLWTGIDPPIEEMSRALAG